MYISVRVRRGCGAGGRTGSEAARVSRHTPPPAAQSSGASHRDGHVMLAHLSRLNMSETDINSSVKRRYNDLSLDLNLDQATADEAWNNYENIQLKYTLEVRYGLFWRTCLGVYLETCPGSDLLVARGLPVDLPRQTIQEYSS